MLPVICRWNWCICHACDA